MAHLRRLISASDYVQCAQSSALFGQPMFVVKHDPSPFPGNPTHDPIEGTQEYNERLRTHGGALALPEGQRTLTELLRAAEDDLELTRALLAVHASKNDGKDVSETLNACMIGSGWTWSLFTLAGEIRSMKKSQVIALRNRSINAEKS